MTSTQEFDKEGNSFWYNSNRGYHRKDGPAVEYIHGYSAWYVNDLNHREDGPARIWIGDALENILPVDKKDIHNNMYTEWFLNGQYFQTPQEMPLSLFMVYCKWML